MADADTKRYSLTELRAMRAHGETRTAPDAPTIEVDEAFWQNARIVRPQAPKVHTGIRLDADMLAWFKAQGRGWHTHINAVLRSYYEAQQARPKG
jgi:uncharacterized protein (DUF4415 family)